MIEVIAHRDNARAIDPEDTGGVRMHAMAVPLTKVRIEELAELIVSRVNVSGCSRVVRERRLPKPPKGMRLEDLGLENRTFN